MDFNEEEAKEHWEKILENFNFLKEKLQRKIGLCLAIFDGLAELFNRRFFEIALEKE